MDTSCWRKSGDGAMSDVISRLAELLSPWRQPKPESKAVNTCLQSAPQVEVGSQLTTRQISPQVAAALLNKPRPDLTARQAEIVDKLKEQCPGFAVMRKLTFGFRGIVCRGKVATLHRWLEEARRTGIHSLERFVRIKRVVWRDHHVVTMQKHVPPNRGLQLLHGHARLEI